MIFQHVRIGARLGMGFGALIVLLVMLAGLGMMRMAQIEEQLLEISNINNVKIQLLVKMRESITTRAIANRNLVLLTDMAAMKPEVARIEQAAATYTELESRFRQMLTGNDGTTAQEKQALDAVRALEQVAVPLMKKVTELGLANQSEEALPVMMGQVRPNMQKWLEEINRLIAYEENLTREAVTAAQHVYEGARNWTIGITAAALAFGITVAWWTTRSITVPLQAAVDVAQAVASGDLTREVPAGGRDETGSLLAALMRMRGSLEQIVGQVRQGTDTIATASSEIANGNLDLSARTEQQASSLEETASSMEQMTSTVQQSAEHARQAHTLVEAASQVAERGGAIVSQVVATMGEINASSAKIVDIISVIDGIAFQTNILALNAAVEAARAGEQGRGFAVVATEVRNLAHRSAAAAKEIKALIDSSVDKVGSGTQLVDQAGTIMSDVVRSVRDVSSIIGEITAASSEQSSGIAQINEAIMQMDDVTQQNASLVEQAAAAAGALREQAAGLVDVVSVFKLPAGMRPSAASTQAPAPARTAPARPSLVLESGAPAKPAHQAGARNGSADWEEF